MIKIKKELFLVIISALLLPSCSAGVQTEYQGTSETSPSEETQSEQNTDEKMQLPSVEPTWQNTKIQLDKNTLTYGKLQITLPDGVTIEEQTAENDMCVINLNGVENGTSILFPPRIWLANYHAEYGSVTGLVSALLNLLPDATLCEEYASGNEKKFFYSYQKPYKDGYILVKENDIYLVEELWQESNYGFGGLFYKGSVRWDDGRECFVSRSGYTNTAYNSYSKINIQSDMSFLVQQTAIANRMRVIMLFQDGYSPSLHQHLAYGKWEMSPEFEDCNFDGCLDMVVPGERIYLWNADQQKYEASQVPKDLLYEIEFFPETKSVWTGNSDYQDDEKGVPRWNMADHTETIWKWEGTALVKQRECVAEVREENVRIWAYEGSPENVLFDENFTIEEWVENSVSVQKQYQKFYDKMIPEKKDKSLHEINYDQEYEPYIPQELLDQITTAMIDKTELETLKPLVKDKKLTTDEVFAIAKENVEMRGDLMISEEYIMVMTDGDNDGIMDILAEEYYGGTGGFTEYVFYQGQEDGTYRRTSSYSAVKEEFAVISYDGKNYLCRTLYDYNKKMYDGFGLACYEDGVQVQAVTLKLFPEDYDVRLAECAEEKYRAFAEELYGNSIHYKDMIDEYKHICGSSEEKLLPGGEYEYQCDLDNDGVEEQYRKSIWEPSNMTTFEILDFDCEGDGMKHIKDILYTVQGTPIMMWAEPFMGKNIINVISLTGLHDFEITGFLLNGAEDEKIYRIIAQAAYGVTQEISAEMYVRK